MRKILLLMFALGGAVALQHHAPDLRVSASLQAQADSNVVVDTKVYQDMRWRSIGPFRGGRVTAVAGVRTQPNVFYMGATGGGVWKTENYGITWAPVTDGQIETGSIGAIDVSDSNPNVIYVGTGSEAIRSNVILGRGVYKSADAGKTWHSVGLRDVGQIGQLKIDPKNPDIAYVAAVGNPFAWTPDRGIFRTKDGGRTWQKVLFINDQTGAVSVAINWSNPNEVYAGAWRTQRRPWTIISGGPAAEGGVYKTTDGGDHWSRVGNGLPDDLIGKVWVDVAQSNPKVIYAQLEAKGPKGGLYRSDDSGAHWTLQDNSQSLRARPFYFNKVYANPKNDNDVWVTELGLHHSTDGGKTFSTVNTPHGDNHAIWFNPDNPRTFIESNDGGANVTQDNGQSWSTQLNQPTAELYMVDADDQFPYRMYAPQQDDGTVAILNVPDTSKGFIDPSQSWFDSSGCESGQIRPTPDGKIIYGDCKGEFGRWNTSTGQEQMYWINPQQRYGKNPGDMKFRFVRQAPIEVDPHNPKVVYHGSQFLHKTTDGGIHWTKISPDVTANGPESRVTSGEPITRDMTGEEVYAALYAIRASRLEPGVIWTGSNDGPVYVTRDGGKTWKNVTPKDVPPGGRVHTIEDSPHRKGSAYVSIYRMYFNDFKPYTYMTNDYGEHWTLLTPGTNGIPADQPMHVVREDPEQEGLLYAGTLQGAYVSFDNGKHWQTLQQNLPETAVTDFKVHHGDLLASTMGRSFWVMDDVAPLRQIAASVMKTTRPRATNSPNGQAKDAATARRGDVVLASMQTPAPAPAGKAAPAASMARQPIKPFDKSNVFLFTPAPAYRTHYPASSGHPDLPEYPVIGARIDYYLANPSGELRLDILDAAGKVARSYTSEGRSAPPTGRGGGRRGGGAPSTLPKKAGMNRFVWDLRYGGAPAAAGGGEGGGFGGGGPLVPPGTYKARFTADGVTKTEPIVVKIDPRVAKDNVTTADLVEQAKFSLKVRDALAEARELAAKVKTAIDAKSGDQAKLRDLQSRLVTKSGPYEDQMFIDQLSNVGREVGQADQKVGASAFDRFNELMKEWASIKADADRLLH
ncbi:MAG TPA: hypothetical protein VHU82_08610 [Vicinamibacterales bacterium]|jgi:photosystem II stability/assembly factor-like uncharacterized protein|nr:hypothetical protein [Vicinamibacterales bacterium]